MTDSRAIGRSTETDCSAADPVRRAVGDYSGTWGSIEVRAADASQAAATDSLGSWHVVNSMSSAVSSDI